MSLKGDSSSAVAVGGLFLSRSSLCKKGRRAPHGGSRSAFAWLRSFAYQQQNCTSSRLRMARASLLGRLEVGLCSEGSEARLARAFSSLQGREWSKACLLWSSRRLRRPEQKKSLLSSCF